jgi:hypothetical protein
MKRTSVIILLSFLILFYIFTVKQDYINDIIKLDNDTFTRMHKFDINKDLLVAIEIQKTGTTEFDIQIQTNLKCIKNNQWTKCCQDGCVINKQPNTPINDIWYYSYHRSHKHECGLHPTYTALNHCIPKLYPKKNLYYFTRLREPIQRYISEWNYIISVDIWNIKYYKTFCEIKNDLCFDTKEKTFNLTLEKFANCPTNPGNNRMARMLALYDYENSECYGEGISPHDMLERAKKTIDQLYWLGLNEYIDESVLLFEKTLSGHLKNKYFKFENKIMEKETIANKYIHQISNELLNKIKENNRLDIQLYDYAQKNFLKRLKYYQIE